MFRPVLVILLPFVLAACTGKHSLPEGILTPEKMQGVMKDLILADEFVSGYIWKFDPAIDRFKESIIYYDRVFTLHRISKEQFQKSLAYYRTNRELLKMLIDSLQAEINVTAIRPSVNIFSDTGYLFKKSLPAE